MNGFIPNEIIEQIRLASEIVEVIGSYVPLKKAGGTFKGICPFHLEKTPSFNVSPEKQIFHCFGCGEGGNVFNFLMKFSNLSFPEAVVQLGEKYGISIPSKTWEKKTGSSQIFPIGQREKYFTLIRKASEYYHQNLVTGKGGKAARDYLQNRNISPNTIKKFFIGYADKNWDSLLSHFLKQKGDLKDLESAGLLKSRKSGTGYYDRFRDRVVFPIFSLDNKICGFGGRALRLDEKTPKYINSPESIIYNKGEILFGLNLAKDSVRKNNFLIIVEGYFDQISLYQHGIENVVASCGTALTKKQAGLIRRYTNNIVLIFDSDEAGNKATTRGFDVLLEYGLNIKVVDLPENTDPDIFINKFGLSKFQGKVKNSLPFIQFIANNIAKKTNLDSLQERIDGLNHILPFLAKIENSIERSEYLAKLAELFRVSDKSLQVELKKAIDKKRGKIAPISPIKTKQPVLDWSECNLIRLMIENPENIEKVKGEINLNDFSNETLKKIAGFLFELKDAKEKLSPQVIVDFISSTTDKSKNREIVTKLLIETIEFDNPTTALEDCIQFILKKARRKSVEELKKQRIQAANFMKVIEFKKLDEDLKDLQRL